MTLWGRHPWKTNQIYLIRFILKDAVEKDNIFRPIIQMIKGKQVEVWDFIK